MNDLEAAWAAGQENTPDGWFVGRPMLHPECNEWSQYAFDPSATPIVGKRSREWAAVGPTDPRCVQEMARCLAELREGRWPEVTPQAAEPARWGHSAGARVTAAHSLPRPGRRASGRPRAPRRRSRA